ncbi:alpha/beta hydrolase [Dactylosporangium matsuzakiense]|uniref:Proteinase n=1 Tax=Dactylosporangium matsuzakiense TaxID=53360 RepID=A0A9W6KLT3_9ACTN|nr:alpha/beta hydrolase [Dactylosporangium matsuzakiense]UWZ43278.1 alpha/beta fold hydrolase [Dactylosporangium matsuzakiense]GLL02616.1 proteinase [Dactylosporangium matsuzakiense]
MGIFAAVALVLLSGGVAAASPATASPPGGLPGVAVPVLSWADCGDGVYQCSSAKVPLDYHRPAGASVTLQLRRWVAADPAHRIGTLFLYAGGPGSSGYDWVSSFASSSPQEIRDKFDIVGYDPRGVQRSQPVSCLDGDDYAAQWAQVSTRPVPGAFGTALRLAGQWDAACQANSAALLPFIGTEAQARDLDVLRAAVGDQKLTYFGESYATYVGTVYANLFPQRTRALILDAGYDPQKYSNDPYAYDYGQYAATESAMYRFLDWCAANPAQCPFAAGTPAPTAAVLATKIHAILDSLDANPVLDADGRVSVNGATMLSELTFRLNSGTRRWVALGTALHDAESRTGPLMYSIGDGDASFNAVNVSVECADRGYPRDLGQLRTRLAKAAADFPLTAPGMAYGPPAYDQTHAPACVQWPAARLSRYTGPYTAHGSAPILVFGNTGDPDTPYADSVVLADTLERGHLVTWQGEGHTARRKSACTETYMYDYLLNLAVPADGTVCTDAPIPA